MSSIKKIYRGTCDVSTAVSLDEKRFLVADDEGETIRLYTSDGVYNSVKALYRFGSGLGTTINAESDIEGAALKENRIFWITSHGRDSKGRFKENRYRFFATDIYRDSKKPELRWVGRYDNLLRDMLIPSCWRKSMPDEYNKIIKLLKKSSQLDYKRKIKKLSPEHRGLNIEGLTVDARGRVLLIGLRNPTLKKKAVLIPLFNPDYLVEYKGVRARFGTPYLLDLNGLGIRSIEYEPRLRRYYIIAGPADSGDNFYLYGWNGGHNDSPQLIRKLNRKNGSSPEAIIVHPGLSRVQILHDEGDKVSGGVSCKDKKLPYLKSFTDRWYDI